MNTQDRTEDYFDRLREHPESRWLTRAKAAHAVRMRTYHMTLDQKARHVAISQACYAVEMGAEYDDAVAAGIRLAETLSGPGHV